MPRASIKELWQALLWGDWIQGLEAGKPQGEHWGEFKALLTENPTAPTKNLLRKVQIHIQPQPAPWGWRELDPDLGMMELPQRLRSGQGF